MVAALRANSSIPYSVIPGIVDCVNSLIGTTVDFLQSETAKLLHDAGVSGSIIADVEAALKRQSDTVNESLHFFVLTI